nr:PREDICTED: hydroxylysine kinase isoform X3 [Bemisia tabaci]
MAEVLKPGEEIKPPVTDDELPDLVESLYGLKITECKELVSYDDKNYHIQVSETYSNNYISELPESGFVLKILNSMSSANIDLIEAQNTVIQRIRDSQKTFKHILFPKLVKTRCGKEYILQELGEPGKKYAVRLFEYIPGNILHGVSSIPLTLFEEIGSTVGRIDLVLKGFWHKGYQETKTVWMLDHIESLEPFLYAVKNEGDRTLVSEVIDTFQQTVMKHYDQFSKGVIHGDFNESNVIVGRHSNCDAGDLHVMGVLDFGDTCYSTYLFELAITITYAILQADDLIAGKHVLKGYTKVNPLSQLELQFLKTCICARLCQSLVMGAYTLLQNPENTYVARTSYRGWRYLKLLRPMDSDALLHLWTAADPSTIAEE